MLDYVELIKGLRDCSRRNARVCMICGAKASNLCDGTKAKRMFYAADAIEELLKEVQSRENDCINLTGECATYYAQIPKWISVEERLPETYRVVLVIKDHPVDYLHGYEFACRFNNGEWSGNSRKVLYWMYLPEPPKEDAE